MCILCIEIAKGKMTGTEIAKALSEYNFPNNHDKIELLEVLLSRFTKAEIETIFDESIREVMKKWHFT